MVNQRVTGLKNALALARRPSPFLHQIIIKNLSPNSGIDCAQKKRTFEVVLQEDQILHRESFSVFCFSGNSLASDKKDRSNFAFLTRPTTHAYNPPYKTMNSSNL